MAISVPGRVDVQLQRRASARHRCGSPSSSACHRRRGLALVLPLLLGVVTVGLGASTLDVVGNPGGPRWVNRVASCTWWRQPQERQTPSTRWPPQPSQEHRPISSKCSAQSPYPSSPRRRGSTRPAYRRSGLSTSLPAVDARNYKSFVVRRVNLRAKLRAAGAGWAGLAACPPATRSADD